MWRQDNNSYMSLAWRKLELVRKTLPGEYCSCVDQRRFHLPPLGENIPEQR